MPYNWNTFRKQRERGEERSRGTFHFLRKTYEKWIRVRSKERERRGGNFELRASIGFVVGELDHENGRVGTRAWAPCQISPNCTILDFK